MKTNTTISTITKNLLLLALPLGVVPVQGECIDPFSPVQGECIDPFQGPGVEEAPFTISLCCEIFSLPTEQAAALMREMARGDLTDEDLHGKLAHPTNKEQVRQEQLIVMRGLSGQRITSESVAEHIYPTEYGYPDPPERIEGDNAAQPDETKAANSTSSNFMPAAPTAFEQRGVGIQIEFEPITHEERAMVDMAVSIEMVDLTGRSVWGQESGKVEMPEFETRRFNKRVTAPLDRPFLLGTLNRPAHSKIDPDSANRVWFVFVTTSKITL